MKSMKRGERMFAFRKVKLFATLCLALCLFPLGAEAAMLRKGKLGGGAPAPAPAANRSVLPKKGDIAVVVDGGDEGHVRVAEAMIVEALAGRGYRVVDEAKMKRIRAAAARAKAARLALQGDVAGILRINASYSVAATVVAYVTAGQPVENEFQLYTGTSSVSLMAVTSNGTKLGGKTAQGKEIGYTEDETQLKAIKSAVEKGMAQMF